MPYHLQLVAALYLDVLCWVQWGMILAMAINLLCKRSTSSISVKIKPFVW